MSARAGSGRPTRGRFASPSLLKGAVFGKIFPARSSSLNIARIAGTVHRLAESAIQSSATWRGCGYCSGATPMRSPAPAPAPSGPPSHGPKLRPGTRPRDRAEPEHHVQAEAIRDQHSTRYPPLVAGPSSRTQNASRGQPVGIQSVEGGRSRVTSAAFWPPPVLVVVKSTSHLRRARRSVANGAPSDGPAAATVLPRG